MNIKTNLVIVVLPIIILLLIGGNEGARFLIIIPMPFKSHLAMFQGLFKTLIERGHEIDIVSFFPLTKPEPRYNDISLQGVIPVYTNNLDIDKIKEIFPKNNIVKYMRSFFQKFVTDLCEQLLNAKVIQDLYININKKKYDAILMELFSTDCMLAFGHKLNDVPIIGLSVSMPLPWINDRIGLPDNPSYLPNLFLNVSVSQMPLKERIYNTVVNFWMKWSYYYYLPTDELIRQKFGDENIPPISELQKKVGLLLVNTHHSYFGSRPLPPNVKEIAGIHIKSSHSLSKNFEILLNNSKNGVIIFSLGSLVRSETFDVEKQRALIEAFGELPYTIIWKTDKSQLIGPIPDNIHFETWIPQQEMLCHPKTKLFITHGGSMGTQESIYCGVPMIAMPFFGDQPLNTRYLVNIGVAVELQYEDLTKETVVNAVNTVLGNSSYKKNAEYRSVLYRDRPMSPIDTAIYWIEYAIEHKNLYHLRPASSELYWYQYYLLDVLTVLFGLIVSIIFIIYAIASTICVKILKLLKNKKTKTKND